MAVRPASLHPAARPARALVAATLAGAALLVVAAPSALASGPVCASGACSETFAETGSVQTWIVPAGVSAATFTLDGAQGGGATAATGGAGGEVTATVPVTAATSISIVVGGTGGESARNGGTSAGGYGGGAAAEGVPGAGGAGGGGGSFVYDSSSLLLVAGGGGGAGGLVQSGGAGGQAGGDGGSEDRPGIWDITGGTGASWTLGSSTCTPGTGGSPIDLGAGMIPGPGLGESGSGPASVNGGVLTPGTGGGGAGGAGFWGGGGGGGGFCGGGSGGSGHQGGGGGGGADFVETAATSVTISDGVNTGDGHVTVSFNQIATTTSVSASSATPVVGGGVTYTATVAPAPSDGTVSFADGGVAIPGCSAESVAAGVATCTVTYQATGSHQVSATFAGSSNSVFTGSAAAATGVDVLAPPAPGADQQRAVAPAAAVVVPGVLSLLTDSVNPFLLNETSLPMRVLCSGDTACTFAVSASIALGDHASVQLHVHRATLAPHSWTTVRLADRRALRSRLRAYLGAHRGAHLDITITVTSSSGGAAEMTRTYVYALRTLPGLR